MDVELRNIWVDTSHKVGDKVYSKYRIAFPKSIIENAFEDDLEEIIQSTIENRKIARANRKLSDEDKRPLIPHTQLFSLIYALKDDIALVKLLSVAPIEGVSATKDDVEVKKETEKLLNQVADYFDKQIKVIQIGARGKETVDTEELRVLRERSKMLEGHVKHLMDFFQKNAPAVQGSVTKEDREILMQIKNYFEGGDV